MLRVLLLTIAITAISSGCGVSSLPGPMALAAAPRAPTTATPVSFATCATAGCHGGAASASPTWQNAATHWEANDPHRHAFVVLYSERAVEMVRRLKEDSLKSDSAYLQYLEQNCTGCHATRDAPTPATHAEAYALGATCTSCHGDAKDWGHQHYRAGWRDEGGKLSAATGGFHDLRDINTRAKVCVTCHVGPAGNHDVNHDLIAAGHPRLDFEFSAYLAILPPHWVEGSWDKTAAKADSAQTKSFHFEAWWAGQLAVARQQEKLASWRTQAAGGSLPDFAQFDCYDCHHDLHYSNRQRWGGWRQLAIAEQTTRVPGLPREQRPLATLLAMPNEHPPQLPPRERKQLLQTLLPQPEEAIPWDQALHTLLALDAALRDDDDEDLAKTAKELRTHLQSCYVAGDAPTIYDSPSLFNPLDSHLQELWSQLREQLLK